MAKVYIYIFLDIIETFSNFHFLLNRTFMSDIQSGHCNSMNSIPGVRHPPWREVILKKLDMGRVKRKKEKAVIAKKRHIVADVLDGTEK